MPVLFEIAKAWFRQTFAWSNTRRAWIDRLAVFGLVLGFLALLWFGRRLSTAQIVICTALLGAAGAVMARRGWVRLFGPILFFDLVRSARRNRYFVVRYVSLLTLFALLFFVHWSLNFGEVSRKWTTSEAQHFTMVYFTVFVVIQSTFLVMLGPAYVAGSIAEEKERQTLEFMLATDLENREIVFGKLISRLGNLLFIFLSGLPFLSVLQFLGGIDPTLIVAYAATTTVGLVSMSCLCMLNSVLNRRSRDAIAISYFCILGYLILSGGSWALLAHAPAIYWINPTELEKVLYIGSAGNPFVLATFATDDVNVGHAIETVLMKYVRDFTIFHLLVSVLACCLSVLALRRYALNQATDRPRRRFGIRWPRPRVLPEPMLWKEVFVERSLYVNVVGRIVFCLLLAVAVATLWYSLDSPRSSGDVIADWVRVVGMVGACLLLLTVAGRASTSISHERDRETIDGLLTTPINTDAILFAKWLGAVLSIRWGILLLAVIYYLGILAGSIHWITLPLMLAAWFVYASVVALLGLWYSVVCRTSTSATVWTYLSTAGLGVGHWLDMLCMVPLFIAGQYSALRYLVLMQAGFTPPVALALSFFVPEDRAGVRSASADATDWLAYGLAGLGAWTVIAVLLWLVTSSRFHLMCGRSTLLERPSDPVEADLESLPDGGLAPATNG